MKKLPATGESATEKGSQSAEPTENACPDSHRSASKRFFAALEDVAPVNDAMLAAAFAPEPSEAAHEALRRAIELHRLDAVRLLLPLNDENAWRKNQPALIFEAARLRFPEALELLVQAREPARRNDECARALIDVVATRRKQPELAAACLRILLPFWRTAWALPDASGLEHVAADMAQPDLSLRRIPESFHR